MMHFSTKNTVTKAGIAKRSPGFKNQQLDAKTAALEVIQTFRNVWVPSGVAKAPATWGFKEVFAASP